MSTRVEKLFEKLSLEDKKVFWDAFVKAILWRGWDDKGKHSAIGSCHACEFIRLVCELGRKYGIEFEEYT